MDTEKQQKKKPEVGLDPTGDQQAARAYNPVDESETTVEQMRSKLVEAHSFANRVRPLSEIALQIDSARSRDEILNTLRNEIGWLVDHDCSFAALLTESRTSYTLHTLSSMADATELDGREFQLSQGTPGWVIDHRVHKSTTLPECPASHPEIEGVLNDLGMKQLLAIPLQTSEDTIGALVLSTARASEYRDQEIWIAQLLSLHSAIALKNLQLFNDARKRITQIELVNEIAEKLTSTLELDELLNSAADAVRKAFNYFDVTIFMLEESGDSLALVAHSGNYMDFLPRAYQQKVSEGVIGWVAKKSEKVLLNDVTTDERYLAYEYHNTKSELAVPIRIEGKVVGVLNVEDTRLNAFDETDAIVLETLCDQLGSVISNAQLYEQVRKTNESLLELDRMKSDFLGIVSHDFRTPLASVILAAKAMAKRGDDLEGKRRDEYLGIIIDQAEKLRQLAEDTLSITKLEGGQLSYHFEIVNVERLVKDAIGLVHFSRRHSVEYDVDPNAAYINGDQTKLRQLIHNLLSNAVKYSPKGGRVRVTAVPESGGRVLLSVSDEGIGIPDEQVGRLFQKFSRVDTPESREIKGSGLGLWICRAIVSGHGGEIWIETEPGKGSTFKFTLRAEQEKARTTG